jgi:DNA-binding NarL/FixJ family response regulator
MAFRILIADDNPHMRQVLRNVIEQNPDWEICGEAVDGKDAIQKAQQLSPDLVVLDFLMPGVNGLDAAREINRALPDLPILMCTMYLSRQLTEIVKSAGCRGAVAKGGVEQLAAGMQALLRRETFFDSVP